MRRSLRSWARKAVALNFTTLEALGFHVTPVVYDSPIPETKELTNELFEQVSECVGLDWNPEVQKEFLCRVFPPYSGEADPQENTWLSLVDAAILHAMVRHHKPRKIVEIGSGWSTRIAARACAMNQSSGEPCELIAIDPYPRKSLRENLPPLTTLIQKQVQAVDLEVITDCDLLFIDSSHVAKIGGDVNFEILEIVPRLSPGALVHWHDILLPGEYWKEWIKDKHYFWNEQYLVHAFLKFNREFEVLWGSRYMHLRHPEAIKAVFPYFEPEKHHITSLWVRRKELIPRS